MKISKKRILSTAQFWPLLGLIWGGNLYGQCSSTTLCVGPGQQYSTIQSAANVAVAGNTVLVFNGTYAGFHSVNGGTASSPITFKANGSSVIINSSGDSNGDNVNIENTNYVIVDGFQVQNAIRAGIRTALTQGVIIRNNIITNSTMWGIFTAFAQGVQILNNKTSGTVNQHGIYVSNSDVPNDSPVLVGNESWNNAQNGIQLNGDCTSLDPSGNSDGVISNAYIQGNYVHDNKAKGFSLIDVQSSTIQNNITWNNGLSGAAAAIHLAIQSSCDADPSSNNIIVNNTMVEPNIADIRITTGANNVVFNNIAVSGHYGTGGIIDESGSSNFIDTNSNLRSGSSTGLFVNAAGNDYHLASGSPAIGAGVSTYQGKAAPAIDFTGASRPQGAVDIGAYAFGSSSCTYSLSSSSANYSSSGGTGSVGVSTSATCAWSAASNVSWIIITAGASGTGAGTVSYSVATNSSSARTGTLTIAGQTFTVTQAAAACSYTISPLSAAVGSGAASGSIAVTAGSGCSWTAGSNASWITVTGGASGSGNGTVTYSVAANSGAARTGTLTVGGQTFTVSQAGACSYAISPTSASFAYTGGTGSITVTAGTGCSWTAKSNTSWLSVTSGSSGSGNGTVAYSAAANTGVSPVSGTLTVAGQTFTVSVAAPIVSSTTDTIWSSSAVPGNPRSPDANPVTLGLKFRSDVTGFVTGIRFYKGTGNNGQHIGLLYDTTGHLLAQATFTAETATGWQQVNFSSPVMIQASTIYIAAFFTTSGYAHDGGYFSSKGVDAPPLHALRSGVSGANGVYVYGSSPLYPNNASNATNYWVDVAFSPAK